MNFMNKKNNAWLVVGVIILLAAMVSAFVVMRPSAKDILTEVLETTKTINDAHAIVKISVDSPEEKASATVEVWGRHEEDSPGGFRLEVLETDKEEAVGAVIVSDGETVWAYFPTQGKVFVGTAEEAKAAMEEKRPLSGEFDKTDFEHPENAEEAVDKLLEYFEAERTGSETVANENAYLLELKPIPEQMPAEYTAVGGLVNLWIDKSRNVPLAVAYTGGSMGEVSLTAVELEINEGVDEARFSFEIPAEVEVVGFAEMKPESLSLDEAAASAEFQLLTPAVTPEGATLVDVLDVRGMIVQRYTLTDGGSFSIAQGQSDKTPKPSTEEQAVEIRGVAGSLFVSEDGDQVLLTWTEGDMFFYVAGDITPVQALEIAESLK
jgi:outer membrane lipoprotein-sorting protein